MNRTWIAVADASRARLFTYERTANGHGLTERITERRSLVNPARRLRPAELFSDSRPGSSRTGGLQYTYDDHRDDHIDAIDAEFARAIVDELASSLREAPASRLILCASPRMLGKLRAAGKDLASDDLVVDDLPRDLVKLTPPQLREHLGSHGLLPPKPARLSV